MIQGDFVLEKVVNKEDTLVRDNGKGKSQGLKNTGHTLLMTEKMLWGKKAFGKQIGIIANYNIQDTLNWWM